MKVVEKNRTLNDGYGELFDEKPQALKQSPQLWHTVFILAVTWA